jgi:hypothetical protein
MLNSENPKFIVRLPIRDETKVAAVKATKASKHSAVRKTVSKDGDWLSTKSKAVKRKRAAATTKVKKPAKAAKAKTVKKKVTKTVRKKSQTAQPEGPSNEVIELSSDEDNDFPDVPLASLKQDSEPEIEEILWDDKSSDGEYEFDD